VKKWLCILCKVILTVVILLILGFGTWALGKLMTWNWDDFWSNFISNAGSSAIIALVLYWIVTQPGEKKAATHRRAKALAMLKMEYSINLKRAKLYSEVLKVPENDLTPYYPLRFTRGAWNALRESGFLPMFDDFGFVYELLRLNEVFVVANKSLTSVRSAKVSKNNKTKLTHYSNKAIKECTQIIKYLSPILENLEEMDLPTFAMLVDMETDGNSATVRPLNNDPGND
jgi:hypothetical protein